MRIRTFVVLENDEVTCNQRIVMHACDQKQIVIKTYLNSVLNYFHNFLESKGKKRNYFWNFSFPFVDQKRFASCRVTTSC